MTALLGKPAVAPNPQSLIPNPSRRSASPPAPGPRCPSPSPQPLAPSPSRSAFTLVELLVTITIIGIMAGIVMGALAGAREAARDQATKATIAKLNTIIMDKYESYLTRRVPVQMVDANFTPPRPLAPQDAAKLRLQAIRYLMMMEMPERWSDVNFISPISLGYGNQPLSKSSLAIQYANKYTAAYNRNSTDVQKNVHAKCLYMIVASNPENMSQFGPSEIGIPDGDGLPVFLDGWGQPINFLRWAPGFSSWQAPASLPSGMTAMPSDIQTGDPFNDHDPFDPRKTDGFGFKLIPLIYSAGPNKQYGIRDIGATAANTSTVPYTGASICGDLSEYGLHGQPAADDPNNPVLDAFFDNVTNHHIEAR